MTRAKEVTTKRIDQKKNMVIGGTKGRTEKAEQPEAVKPEPKPVISTPKAVKVPKKKARKTKKNG